MGCPRGCPFRVHGVGVIHMREACIDCGKTWGVTEEPRKIVRCSACASPKPWRDPVWYWQARIWNFPHGYVVLRSPEWWDMQASRQDLRVAVGFARTLEQPGQLLAVA